MASIAATATGFRTSEAMPSTFTAPCCCNTFAIPIAVASSHQREKSVSMITRGPVAPFADAPAAGARVVDDARLDAEFAEPEEQPTNAMARSTAAATIEPVDGPW